MTAELQVVQQRIPAAADMRAAAVAAAGMAAAVGKSGEPYDLTDLINLHL